MSLGNLGPNGRPKGNLESPRTEDEVKAANPAIGDHHARAKQRIAEFRAQHGTVDDIDVAIDPWFAQAPDGWDYEWKTKAVWNKEFPSYIAACIRTGWSPVPYERHRNLLYDGYEGQNIEKEGMILMERPKELTNLFRERDKKRARAQVFDSEAKLRDAPSGTAPRDQHPQTMPRVGGHVGPVEIDA